MLMPTQPIVVTPGDPAGIGPDILLDIVCNKQSVPLVAIADKILLQKRALQLNYPVQLIHYHDELSFPLPAKTLAVHHIPMPNATNCHAGTPLPEYANYILNCLQTAAIGCVNNRFSALVTGPVNKQLINQAGITFSGHTEFLAHLTNSPHPVMLLQTQTLKVALLTTHLPLREVASAVTTERLIATIQVIDHDLRKRFHIPHPNIFICGLNPHAGDGGYIGDEEQKIIIPAIKTLQAQGYQLTGPVSADTAFTQEYRHHYDVILAMYHDQGLPVLKTIGFNEAVNVTLGLPIIRTSVDHGTAYDLAGSGKANANSLWKAILVAEQFCANIKSTTN